MVVGGVYIFYLLRVLGWGKYVGGGILPGYVGAGWVVLAHSTGEYLYPVWEEGQTY